MRTVFQTIDRKRPPESSWWQGLTRTEFSARAHQEFETRMRHSADHYAYAKPGLVTDAEHMLRPKGMDR